MILQALTHCYEDLLKQGKIGRPGWSQVKVAYGLDLDAEGNLVQLLHLQQEVTRGKKKALAPRELLLPAQVKRSVAVAANFLCDNSGYLLGADSKGKPERTAGCFAAAQACTPSFCGMPPPRRPKPSSAFLRAGTPLRHPPAPCCRRTGTI